MERINDFDDAETRPLREAAKKAGAYVALGISERSDEGNGGTLYNSLLYIGPTGDLLGIHRKLMPTGSERLIWGCGDGSTLTTLETPFGVIGGLICWENYMPLARMAMYAKGVSIYLAPTADHRDSWGATLRHIACEGRCFVLGCNQYFTRSMYPPDLALYEELANLPEELCRGGSAIVDPFGEYVCEPLYGRKAFSMPISNWERFIRVIWISMSWGITTDPMSSSSPSTKMPNRAMTRDIGLTFSRARI